MIVHAYYEGKGEVYKVVVKYATCNENFRFAGTGLMNVHEIVRQATTGQNTNVYFEKKTEKLSNLGTPLYISMQMRVDIITLNEVVIWSRFPTQTEFYLQTAKNL